MGIGFCLGIAACMVVARSGLFFSSKKFKNLASEALYNNSNRFIELADKYFSSYRREAQKDLETRGDQILKTVEPVRQTLDRYERHLFEMEKDREKAYGAISERLLKMGQTQNLLQLETANLVKALRVPHVRGRWGEITLKRVAELAGMTQYCDFAEQVSAGSGKGTVRPDMVVTLPSNRKIVVDAKVPLMAYLDALEAPNEDERQERMRDHGRQVLNHIHNLGAKKYMDQFSPTPEFVVLFIPGENFFSAALSSWPDLIEKGIERGVILATPTTLIALLKAVAYSWKQQKAYENAEVIRNLGVELYKRLCHMTQNINRLGKDISKCVNSYNRTVGAMEKRVMPTARNLENLDISNLEIEPMEPIETSESTTRVFCERFENDD